MGLNNNNIECYECNEFNSKENRTHTGFISLSRMRSKRSGSVDEDRRKRERARVFMRTERHTKIRNFR